MKIRAVIAEFRRRRVFRVLIAYAIVAWGLMQVGEVAFPALGLPDWTLTLVVVLSIFGFPVAFVLAWAFDMTPDGFVRTSSENAVVARPAPKRERLPDDSAVEVPAVGVEPADEPARRREGIVVLPFENMSTDAENEYFSDGLAEDLIARLSQTGTLRVISRTSAWKFKDVRMSATEVADQLGVEWIIEGSVRRAGDRLRIVAQLIDADADEHLWSETYDRQLADIFDIQSDVAEHIADALHTTLVRGSSKPTEDLEAYDLYLRGRYLWNKRSASDLAASIKHFDAAVERDAGFALAQAALAEAYVTLAVYGLRAPSEVVPLANAAAEAALERDQGQVPALTAAACARAIHDWDWEAAEHGFREAITVNPGYATARQWLAVNVLATIGRFEDAEAELELARAGDPASPSIAASFAVVALWRRDFDTSTEICDAILADSPEFGFGHFIRGQSLLYAGRPGEAAEALERAVEFGGESPENLAALGSALAALGREEEARRILENLTGRRDDRYVSATRISKLHAALGEGDRALDWLETALAERAADLIWIEVSPASDPIREEPRFRAVRDRVLGRSAGQA